MKRSLQVILLVYALVSSGCAFKFSQRSGWDVRQLATLSQQLERFRALARLNAEEASRLRQAKNILAKRLGSEISRKDVSVGFDNRGLVVRVLDKLLFDSGKASLKPESLHTLEQVARILTGKLAAQPVGVEGHTDNEPIKRSAWKDNWELSLARARAVLTHLVQAGVDPSLISATGFGEYRPIFPNDTPEHRQQNRRVEIVILPNSAGHPVSSGSVGEGGQVYEYSK